MIIIGIILIVFGAIWLLGNLLNQPKRMELLHSKIESMGAFRAISRQILIELLLGLGLGIFLIIFGIILVIK
jgi:flagellar biogenesis protein FliO